MVKFLKPASQGLALILALAAVAAAVGVDDPKGDAKGEQKLVGTWKVVSAKYGGEEVKWPEGTTTVKHVTPTHFMWATYDKDGKVIQAAGGPYTRKGEDYAETPEYGVGAVFEKIKGKTLAFKCKVEGNKWYHTGQTGRGQTLEEVWERVERK
jgi:hypothetical protein